MTFTFPKPMQLSTLPNQEGYRFTGVRRDGTLAACYIWKDKDGTHHVDGEARYSDLVGWFLESDTRART